MAKTPRRPTVWDPTESRSAARRIRDWERNCTLLASIPGCHQQTWFEAMLASMKKSDRERVPC